MDRAAHARESGIRDRTSHKSGFGNYTLYFPKTGFGELRLETLIVGLADCFDLPTSVMSQIPNEDVPDCSVWIGAVRFHQLGILSS
jgi:hypothetical protein